MSGQTYTNKVMFGLRPTRITEGLGVSGEVSSQHLASAYGIDQPHYINMGYAKIFSATDRYHDKPINNA
jgi:hypothetical protein